MFNESSKVISVEDYDYWLRISMITKIDFISDGPLLLLRKWQNNISKGLINNWQRSLRIHLKYKKKAGTLLFLKTLLNDSLYYFISFIK